MGEVLFQNCRYLITSTHANGGVLENCDLLVTGNMIKALGASTEIRAHHHQEDDLQIIDCSNK